MRIIECDIFLKCLLLLKIDEFSYFYFLLKKGLKTSNNKMRIFLLYVMPQ
ncbi:hypothetical protein KsCSTR_27500 [Candidatus Kuenenia stuttgartiensis]|uniref:Uncharacterized protein n=1 Tax=Kuenenia stuttgartiensis TaxID=174633 RepID=A0A6G7GS53_KUEST|nr:hypothetical protein KsCSTR_27500 [Candidatus Kuenenia stuttgartiensis]